MNARQWVTANCRMAQSGPWGPSGPSSGPYGEYGKELDYGDLERLHTLWYTIHQLEGKFSEKAEAAREDAKADFYMLARKVGNSVMSSFGNWLYVHRMPGWWIRKKEFMDDDRGHQYLDDVMHRIADEVLPERVAKLILDEYQDIDLAEYVRNSEIGLDAMKFLTQNGVESDARFDDEAVKVIVGNDDLLDNYVQFLKNDPGFLEYFNPKSAAGDEWWDADHDYHRLFMNSLTDDIGQMAFEEFSKAWPNYAQVADNIEGTLKRLQQAMSAPDDYNGVMSAISLSLNAAHNSGIMAEHVGLSGKEMEQLSNMKMDDADTRIKRFMSKLLTGANGV